MGDRSKIQARRADVVRQFEEAKRERENPPPRRGPRCTFCRKADHEVERMVHLGEHFICSECTDTLTAIMADGRAKR